MASIDPFDGLPPEIAMEERALKRRQAIAEAMMQRGMAPMPGATSSGRYLVAPSPLAGIAQILQGYSGRKQLEETDKAYSDLGTKYQKGVTDAIMQYQQQKAGTPGQAAIESPPDELGGGPGREATPGTPADPRAAVTAAMLNPYLRNNPMVSADMKALQPTTLGRSMVIPATGEVVATDQTWQQERADAAAAKKAELEAKLADTRASREEKAAAAKDLAQMRIDAQREAQRDRQVFAASVRQPREPKVIETADGPMLLGPGGQATPITGPGGQQLKPKSGRSGPMSATAQKELIETEEQIQGSQAALSLLKQAKTINTNAMGFTGAGAVASVGSLLPESIRPGAVDATQDLDNILQSQALPQMKSIFGGNPTEGERKILLDIQGSSSKPPAVREKIFERAETAINNRLKFNADKVKRLREGTYFTGDGLPSVAPPGAPPPAAPAGAAPPPPPGFQPDR